MDTFNVVAASLRTYLGGFGPSESFYLLVVGAIVVASFAFLRRPFINLILTIFYLAIANPPMVGTTPSAVIAALLIGNCVVGTVMIFKAALPVDRSFL